MTKYLPITPVTPVSTIYFYGASVVIILLHICAVFLVIDSTVPIQAEQCDAYHYESFGRNMIWVLILLGNWSLTLSIWVIAGFIVIMEPPSPNKILPRPVFWISLTFWVPLALVNLSGYIAVETKSICETEYWNLHD